jgi:alkaline phosphatase D
MPAQSTLETHSKGSFEPMQRAMRLCWLSLALSAAMAAVARADDEPLSRIAFGSCANQDHPQPVWDAIVVTQPELFLFLGDNVYADTEDME